MFLASFVFLQIFSMSDKFVFYNFALVPSRNDAAFETITIWYSVPKFYMKLCRAEVNYKVAKLIQRS